MISIAECSIGTVQLPKNPRLANPSEQLANVPFPFRCRFQLVPLDTANVDYSKTLQRCSDRTNMPPGEKTFQSADTRGICCLVIVILLLPHDGSGTTGRPQSSDKSTAELLSSSTSKWRVSGCPVCDPKIVKEPSVLLAQISA